MPILTRRQQMLAPRQLASGKPIEPIAESIEALGETLWAAEEDYKRPHKELDFPLTPLGRVPSRKDSMDNLRINTYAATDLYERYLSEEEEPSSSPDSDTESNEEELKHKTPGIHTTEATEATEPLGFEEYKAEIAIAVPIMAIGRPKLVDITNLAPMHKRKLAKPTLSRLAAKNAASRIPAVTDENSAFIAREATKVAIPEDHIPKRKDSLSVLAPDTWLPDDVTIVEEQEDHYFPDLELRNPPTYHDYDPYSLDPPRLSPRNSYNTSTDKKPGSVARARNNSNPPVAMNNGWKGLTRSLSMAKKQALHRGDQQITKKPKMVARPANERDDPFMIPGFPIGEKGVD